MSVRKLITELETLAVKLGDETLVSFITSDHFAEEGRVDIEDIPVRIDVVPPVESRHWPKPAAIRIVGEEYEIWNN